MTESASIHPPLIEQMLAMGRRARAAALNLRARDAGGRTLGLRRMAEAVRDANAAIVEANAADLAAARSGGMAGNLLDRLRLDRAGVMALATAIETIAGIADPVGVETARWARPNGLDIARVRTPIGVLAVIYEARPNVTGDAAALCLRSGNAVILRGGSESLRTNLALHRTLVTGLSSANLPADAVQLVPTADREAVGLMLRGLDGAIDLLIPRGGKSLVARVRAEARVAVLGHLEGLCHTYVDASADPDMAVAVVVNAKMRRTSVCGATETLLVDLAAAPVLLPRLAEALGAAGCALRGDARARDFAPGMAEAHEDDWVTEYLAPILAVRVVDGVAGAVDHIARYGSGHTDAILAQDADVVAAFTTAVDSAIVMVNASTQFADGAEFGFGGEIGISTDRLHARGPVGAEQLTTYKYIVRGQGAIRP